MLEYISTNNLHFLTGAQIPAKLYIKKEKSKKKTKLPA